MKKIYRALSRARIAAAGAVFVLFAFLYTAPGPAGLFGPAMDWQFSPRAAGAGFAAGSAALFIVLALILGRVFCSVFCPMGAFQELLWRVSGRLGMAGRKYVRPWRLRYAAAVLAAAGAITLNMPLFSVMDPISNFGRVFARINFSSFDSVPGTLPKAAVIFAVIAVFACARGRRFCDWCPAGVVLGFASHIAPFGMKIDASRCAACGLCEKVCPMNCADSAGRRIDKDRCVLCMECAAGCPGAFISFGPDAGVKTDGEGRRHFVKRICAFIIGAGYIGGRNVRDIMRDNFFASAASPDGEIPARPPGAADDGHFSSRCIGCLACAAVCPTGIIRSVGSIQPCLVYGSGYCQFNCVECGRVCPTDAITRLNAETKRRTRVALSDLTLPRCVVITKSQACGACAEVCPTRALSMVRGGAPGLTEPSFDGDYCIGCGACIAVCPAEPNAFALKGVRVQSLTPGIRELEDDGGTTPMSAGDDFPF